MTEILAPILTDHSSVLFPLSKGKDCLRGKGFWKFNSPLTKDQNYITEFKKLIRGFCTTNASLYNRQLKWELLKCEVRKLTSNYTKQIAKEKKQKRTNLGNQLKILEKSLDEDYNLSKYNAIKNKLDAIMIILQKEFVAEANANGINNAKNQKSPF